LTITKKACRDNDWATEDLNLEMIEMFNGEHTSESS